ncbi:MAG: twin-arginine translocation signal domain-containing protein, partial [Myxococcota bacterium]
MTKRNLNRRKFLQFGAAASAALALPLWSSRRARAQVQPDRRFLFVISATGGGSIIDSLLPVADSTVTGPNPDALVSYPDAAIV